MKYLEEIATPFFLLDEKILLSQVKALKKAVEQYWNNAIIGYSVKTNSMPFLAHLFREQGVWAETVSEDEYELMLACGYTGNEMICNGPIKSHDYVERLLAGGALLNIDSHDEIEHVITYKEKYPDKPLSIGIRVNLDVRGLTGEHHGGRFGFSFEQGDLRQVIQQLHQHDIRIAGLHLHTGVLSGTLDKYEWLTEKFCQMVEQCNIKDEVAYLDIGGGFYGYMEDKPTWNDYLKVITDTLHRNSYDDERLRLILEPGASMLAGAFSYYTTVTDIKRNALESFAFCDGSRIHIDPLMHKSKSSYSYSILRKGNMQHDLPYSKLTLVGFTCMENDRIMEMGEKEILCKGDRIVFHKVGSYTSTLSPMFINFPPAVYCRREDQTIACIREKWRAKEFLQKSTIL